MPAYFVYWFYINKAFLGLKSEHFKIQRHLIFELVKLGLPLALQNGIISIGGIIVQFVVNGYGVIFVAGFTATNKLYGLLETAAISFGYALTTYNAQNYGALEYQLMRGIMLQH